MAKRLEGFMLASAVGLLAGSAHSADPISVGTLEVDRPTLHALGVRLLISGDDDRDAVVSVRYRKLGDSTWREGLPLLRVWPETVSVPVPQQFAGSVFDLTPDTDYEIELSVTDPDGGNATKTATAKTRPVPRTQPAAPNAVNVTNVTELTAALAAAKAGDVITLADGSYAGSFFSVNASGTTRSKRPLTSRSRRDRTPSTKAGCFPASTRVRWEPVPTSARSSPAARSPATAHDLPDKKRSRIPSIAARRRNLPATEVSGAAGVRAPEALEQAAGRAPVRAAGRAPARPAAVARPGAATTATTAAAAARFLEKAGRRLWPVR